MAEKVNPNPDFMFESEVPKIQVRELGDFRQYLSRLLRKVVRGFMIAYAAGSMALGSLPASATEMAGNQFQVNSTTANVQKDAAVAMDDSGNFVTVWDDNGAVKGQRYDANGTAQGSEFTVATSSDGVLANPDVAMDSDGDFVVVWEDNAFLSKIQLQRYNSSGVGQGLAYVISSGGGVDYNTPAVAMDDAGNFALVWAGSVDLDETDGISLMGYNAAGVWQFGDPTLVNADYTTGIQANPDVAMDSDGDIVVVWDGAGDGATQAIWGQRFDSSGTAQGSNTRIINSPNPALTPAVAMDDAGIHVVSFIIDGAVNDFVMAYQFDASGTLLNLEGPINTVSGSFAAPDVACDSDGDFVVTWNGIGTGDTQGIYAQEYDSDFNAQGGNLLINHEYTTGTQASPAVAMDSDGDFAIAWHGESGDDSEGISARFTDGPNFGATDAETVDDNTNSIVEFNTEPTAVEMYLETNDVAGSCNIDVQRFADSPVDQTGISENNVGIYRWVIETDCTINSNIEVCFDLDNLPGHSVTPGNEGNVVIYKRTTPGTGAFAAPGLTTYDGHSDNELCIQTNSFSEFAFGSNDSPLPVDFAAFHGEVVKEGIRLHWETGSEINNKGFYVYRDGIRISGLIAGQGTTNQAQKYSFLDKNVKPNQLYRYMISDIAQGTNAEEFHNEISIVADASMLQPSANAPASYALHNAYPNPFNPSTVIGFDLPIAGNVNLKVYDVNGQLVRSLLANHWEAGYHSTIWNGQDDSGQTVSSGLYFYTLEAEGFSQTNSMILMK